MQSATDQSIPHANSSAAHVPALRRLAHSLYEEDRQGEALLLFEHLAKVQPRDSETLRPLVKLLGAAGRTLDAIEALCELKTASSDMHALLSDIQTQLPNAIERFNAHRAAGEVQEAERFAAAMVTLVPRNAAFLDVALSCNLALGDKAKAVKYARMLHQVDSSHERARAVLDEFGTAASEPVTEDGIGQRLTEAPSPKANTHPLLTLRDIHDAASSILCAPLTESSTAQIGQLLNAANQLEVPVPPDSEWTIWEKHYRLMLDAIDLPLVLGPTPDTLPGAKIELRAPDGTSLKWADVRKAAERVGARAVFFAAADRAYLDLYGRLFIKSILKHCDVPCLVIVLAIGGAKQLPQIAKSIGVRDKRLIYAGDAFDAGAVSTKCYDTPPKGMIAKPVAHLQSVRFLRLATLLRELKLPVFVSDIDLLLQRGVSDLLDRCGEMDVVFNENTISENAGSRLTANLLLVNPTANAAVFLCFLRQYLERMLAKDEVTRWIDQFGLLMARHHLLLKGKLPHIGYFDTARDINNVMYRSYQENPFRFLSLYHGFDLSSLKTPRKPASPRPKAKTRAKPQKKAKRARR